MSGISPLSAVVAEFEADTRMRFSRGQNPSLMLMLKAVDDAVELCDHVGLTLVRARLNETLELVNPGRFRSLLEQLLLEVKAAERMAVRQVKPEKKTAAERNDLLSRARHALAEDQAAALAAKPEPELVDVVF